MTDSRQQDDRVDNYSSNSEDSSAESSQSSITDTDTEGFQVINVFSTSQHISPDQSTSGTADQTKETAQSATQTLNQSPIAHNHDRLGNEHLHQWVKSMIEGSTDESHKPFLETLRMNKSYHNPAIFEKMVSYCGINASGTNHENVIPLTRHEYYEEINDLQDLCTNSDL